MKNTIFTGMATAIVTPMKADLTVDYEALGRFIDFQIEQGINALVSVGTTGESASSPRLADICATLSILEGV